MATTQLRFNRHTNEYSLVLLFEGSNSVDVPLTPEKGTEILKQVDTNTVKSDTNFIYHDIN